MRCAIVALLSASTAAAQPVVAPPSPAPVESAPPVRATPGGTVGVIMRVAVDPDGRPTAAEVFRTIPVGAGQPAQASVNLPEPYLAALRSKLLAMKFNPQSPAFRFFVFDPAQPTRIDLGPDPASTPN